MSAPNKSGSKYVWTDQERDNNSHDDKWGVNAVELVGENATGTALNRVVVNDSGAFSTASTPPKSSDEYGINAISEDATYKYFWFEADDLDYYIMRKNKTTSVFTFTKGTGGYTSVYINETSGPTGSPTWGTRGATF